MNKPVLAIIGFGRFGRFAATHLKKYASIVVADHAPGLTLSRGVTRVSMEEAASQRYILLSVPVGRLQDTLKEIAPHVRPQSMVCDVCAVKQLPIQWMRSLLPRSVFILGSHPLFGPASGANGIRGLHVVLCPVRVPFRDLQTIHTGLRKAGLIVHHMSPVAHDRLMARTLFLTQFVGRAAARLEQPTAQFSTPNFELLNTIVKRTKTDSFELFRDLYRFNPYAAGILKKVQRESIRLKSRIAQGMPGNNP